MSKYSPSIVMIKCSPSIVMGEIYPLLIDNKPLEDVIELLNSKTDVLRPVSSINFLKSLYEYIMALEKNLPDFNDGNKKTYILHVCCWGKDYAHKMMSYLVPSLLADGNIPSFYTKYNIIFYVHCDQDICALLSSSVPIIELQKFAKVSFEIIPSMILLKLRAAEKPFLSYVSGKHTIASNSWKYYLLGALQNYAMLVGKKDGALVSFLMPDLLLSKDALSNLLLGIQGGRRAAVSTAFRSAFTDIKDEIGKHYVGVSLQLDGQMLTELIVKNMHDTARNRIVSSLNLNFNLTPQLIFSYQDEIVIRSFNYHPMLIDFAEVSHAIPSNYYPIDNFLLGRIINDDIPIENQIWVNLDSMHVAIMEVSEEGVEGNIIESKIDLNLVETISDYLKSLKLNKVDKFLLARRFVYKARSNENLISDICDIDLIPLQIEN